MKEEILNELFFSNNKKANTFNSEQKKEYQEMVAQIKKIGPGIVEKYNRDYKLLDSLKRAVRRDLLPYDHGQPDVTTNINVKFSFSMTEKKNISQRVEEYQVYIDILDKSVMNAIEKYLGEINPDNCMDCTEEIIGKIYEEVGEAITQSLSPKTLIMTYTYWDLYEGLAITFDPKANYNESANIAAINEICDNVSEWIDDIDEDYVMEADIEYISESVGDVFKKINSNIESHKKSIKDKITKFKDKVHKNYDTRSLSNLKAGKFFTDKDIVIDNYVDLRSPADISKDVNDLFDDITIVFEDAWKKITKERENKNSFTDYKSAIKIVDDTKKSLEKKYDDLDSKDKMAKIFNLDKKKEKHTLTNKELARFIDYMKSIYKLHDSFDRLYTNSIDVMAEYNNDLKDLAKEYNYAINDSKKSSTMSDEDKDYLRYLTDSAKVLSDIIERTFGALDSFYTWYANDQDDYVALLESYLKAAGIDMNNTKTAKHLLTNSATEDNGEVIEEAFFDKNKDPKKEKLSAEQLYEVKSLKDTIKKVAPDIIKAENKNKDAVDGLAKAIDELTCTDQKIAPKFEYTADSEGNNYIAFWAYSKPIVNAINKEYEEGGEVDYHFIKFTDSATSYIIKQIKKELNMKTVSAVVYGGSGNSANSIEFVFIPKDKSKKYNSVKESTESLDEGFVKDLIDKMKKHNKEKNKSDKIKFTDEQIKERKDLVKQIDAIAKPIVEKYAKDKKMIKKLEDAVNADIPDSKDDDEFDKDYELKNADIGFDYVLADGYPKNNDDPSAIAIFVISDNLDDILYEYRYHAKHYNTKFTNIEKIVKDIYKEIEDKINKEVKPKTLDIKFEETEVGDGFGLDIRFIPKKSSTNESSDIIEEAAAATKAYNLSWKYKTALKSNSVFDDIEQDKGISIDNEVKEFIKKTNGATPDKTAFKVGNKERVYGTTVSFNKGDKDNVYSAMNAVKNNDLLPIVADPFGNYVCYNVKNSSIVFWDHETDKVSKVSNSLSSFLSSLHSTDQTNESALITEAVKSSIKNPIGKGNLTKIDSIKGAWGCDKIIPETIFGKEHKIYIHIYTHDYNASGLNPNQQTACDYYNKNKVKMYRELGNELLKYANSFLDSHEQPFELEDQLNMLFIPDGLSLDNNGVLCMELENVFDIEHGIFVHMYPGKMYCTDDPIF